MRNTGLFVFFAAVSLSVFASGAAVPLAVNVRGFGAKGDGVTDDSAAIQKAINEAAKHTRSYPRMWGAAYPEIFIPAGEYKISKTLVLATGLVPGGGIEKGKATNNGFSKGMGFAYVRGEAGKTVIRQTNPSADIFYVGMAYKTLIENLTFDGGRHAVNMWTGNQDCAMPIIRGCRFLNSSGYAVQTPYIHKNEAGDFVGNCVVNPDGTLTETSAPDAKHFLYHSTYLHIDNCDFIRCAKVLFTSADMALMENCRIETHPNMKGAAIRSAGLLKLYNIQGVANVTEGNEQRWIDLDFGATNWLVGEKLKLKGKAGGGLCAVYCLDKFRLSGVYNPGSIVLRDSEFDLAGCPEKALIYCRELTNIISVSGCVNSGAEKIPVLGFEKIPDEAYFKALVLGGRPIVQNGLAYMIDSRNKNFDTSLPPAMEPYRRHGVPESAARQADEMLSPDKDAVLSLKSFPAVSKSFNLAAFGAAGDGVTDDSAAIQKAFDAAAGESFPELVIPGKVYKISGVINLPSNILLRGSGRAVFMAPDQSQFGFRVAELSKIAVLNCSFESGGRQFDITAPDGGGAKIFFDNCSFANSCAVSIVCRSAGGAFSERVKNTVRVTNSLFYNNRGALDSNIYAVMDSCWLAGYAVSFKEGVDIKSKRSWEGANFRKGIPEDDLYRDIWDIRNDGVCRAENVLGVPMGKGWGRKFRWFDNTGTLICDYFRFGGEQAGRRAVDILPSNENNKNIVIIQNSWLHHTTGAYAFPDIPEAMVPQAHMVYCDAVPDLLILRDNIGSERSYLPHGVVGDMVQTRDAAILSALKDRLIMSCNIVPETISVRKTPEEIRALSSGKK